MVGLGVGDVVGLGVGVLSGVLLGVGVGKNQSEERLRHCMEEKE